MPLTREFDVRPVFHRELRGLDFRMVSNGDAAPRQIRVVITFQALAAASRTEIEDLPTALQCFARLRSKIEAGASAKFGRIGPGIDQYQGVPHLPVDDGRSVMSNFWH
ncbi:MAG: hypothetical protein GY844_01320 [Bradyrhizobium sp.]|nr:hypothetical protein [Bradyrhizobium sp.]